MSSVYGAAMAEAYPRGRHLQLADLAAWTTAAAPYLPGPLRPGGHLLLRGGFDSPQEIPLRRWFPSAFRDFRPLLATVTARLGALGMSRTAHTRVPQRYAASAPELVDKVASRSLSNLATLPDEDFAAGLAAVRRDAPSLSYPLEERLDLIAFTR